MVHFLLSSFHIVMVLYENNLFIRINASRPTSLFKLAIAIGEQLIDYIYLQHLNPNRKQTILTTLQHNI